MVHSEDLKESLRGCLIQKGAEGGRAEKQAPSMSKEEEQHSDGEEDEEEEEPEIDPELRNAPNAALRQLLGR